MILVFEMTWRDIHHAASNAGFLQILRGAFPGKKIIFFAEKLHIQHVKNLGGPSVADVEYRTIPLPVNFYGRPQIVSFARFFKEIFIFTKSLWPMRSEKCFFVLTSSTATGMFAADLCGYALLGKGSALQIGLHGDLNYIATTRSRNPLARMLDIRAALLARHRLPTRFLVLEESIPVALPAPYNRIRSHFDVLPHQITDITIANNAERPSRPLRIGLIGQGTPDKGMNIFLDIARRSVARLGDAVAFHHIGRIPPGITADASGVLADPPTHEPLPQDVFDSRISALHYALLPLDTSYYNLSASGGLLDAIRHGKPVIVPRISLTESYFQRFGDIGYLYDSSADLDVIVDEALDAVGKERYLHQVRNVSFIRQDRSISRSAEVYRKITDKHYSALLNT